MDRLPENPPHGYKKYPGGHFLSYDLDSGEIKDLALVPDGEGMVAMTMDTEASLREYLKLQLKIESEMLDAIA